MFSIQGFQTCIGQEKPDHNAEPVVGLHVPTCAWPTVPPPANAADQHGSGINHCSSQTSENFGESCLTLDMGAVV
jgi:hypothetical protein